MMQLGENRQIVAENLEELECLKAGANIQAKLSNDSEYEAGPGGASYYSFVVPRWIRHLKQRLTAPPSEYEEHLQSQEAQSWERFRGWAQYRVDARIQNGVINPADREIHKKAATREAYRKFQSNAEIPIDPQFTDVALEGLAEVARRGRVWGHFNRVDPGVARDMIAAFQTQEVADSVEQTIPISVDTQ